MHQTPKCKLDLTVLTSSWIPPLPLVSWIPPHGCVLLYMLAKGACALIWRCGGRTGDEACWAGLFKTKTLSFTAFWLLGPNWREHTTCFYIGQQIIFVNKILSALIPSIPRTGWLEYHSFCIIIYFCFVLERDSSIHQEQFPDFSYASRKSCLISNKWLIAKWRPSVDVITFSEISEWSAILKIRHILSDGEIPTSCVWNEISGQSM